MASSSPLAATATTVTTVTTATAEEEHNERRQDGSIIVNEEEETTIIRIDGSMGEGGGQLLRNAISLATLLNRPMMVHSIRAGRSKPGLQAQHVASLQLPVEICCCHDDSSVDDQQEQEKQQQSHAAKRQKDDGNDNGTMISSINNDQTITTNCRLGVRGSVPFLTGDTLHSQEIQFQPPPPPPPLPEQINHKHDNEREHQHERTITKDIGTAGSICLLLQAALPCAIFTSLQSRRALHLHLHGGTNATLAPQYDYWERVFLPTLQEQCGFNNRNHHNIHNGSQLLPNIHARVIRRGYFPRGGGHVCITVQPPPPATAAAPSSVGVDTMTATTTAYVTPCLHPIQLTERGQVKHIYIRSFHAGRLPRHLAETVAFAAEKLLRKAFPSSSSSLSSHQGRGRGRGHPPQQQQQQHLPKQHHSQQQHQQRPTVDIVLDIVTEPEAVGSGLGILVVATTTTGCRLAGSALSDPKKKAADVGRAAAQELLDALKDGGCVDEWLQDQLILYMALAKGVSEIKTGSLTLHTRTAIEIAQVFCGANCFEIHKLGSDGDDTGSKAYNSEDSYEKKQATNEGLCNGQNEISGCNVDDESYGMNGRIAGQHLIRCHGIGHTISPL